MSMSRRQLYKTLAFFTLPFLLVTLFLFYLTSIDKKPMGGGNKHKFVYGRKSFNPRREGEGDHIDSECSSSLKQGDSLFRDTGRREGDYNIDSERSDSLKQDDSLRETGRRDDSNSDRQSGKKSQLPASSFSRDTHPWLFARPQWELQGMQIPNQVFFLWCVNTTFTFTHYLSVLAAWKLLEPNKMEILRAADLQQDNYNQWLQELKATIPVLSVQFVDPFSSICSDPLLFALQVLSDRGGIYLDISTLLLRSLHPLRKRSSFIGFSQGGNVAFIGSGIHAEFIQNILQTRWKLSHSQMVAGLKDAAEVSQTCAVVSSAFDFVNGKDSVCLSVPDNVTFGPLDLRHMPNRTVSILRDIYYTDLEEVQTAKAPSLPSNIPFITHYAWFGKANFTFSMYLSFLSTVYVARVDKVYIHTDLHLYGKYWDAVRSHPKVILVYTEPPATIYTHKVKYIQHRSDVLRADVLDKYGGVYTDWDVLWLRSPRPLLSARQGVVVNLDHMPRPGFRDVLNLGVVMAVPRARYVRLWRGALREYRSDDFYYNALELPYKIYERHPDTVSIQPRLQVMCLYLKCHPIFHPDYRNWDEAQPFRWQTDVYSIHFTHPDPPQFIDLNTLLNSSGTFADMGRYILSAAHRLPSAS